MNKDDRYATGAKDKEISKYPIEKNNELYKRLAEQEKQEQIEKMALDHQEQCLELLVAEFPDVDLEKARRRGVFYIHAMRFLRHCIKRNEELEIPEPVWMLDECIRIDRYNPADFGITDKQFKESIYGRIMRKDEAEKYGRVYADKCLEALGRTSKLVDMNKARKRDTFYWDYMTVWMHYSWKLKKPMPTMPSPTVAVVQAMCVYKPEYLGITPKIEVKANYSLESTYISLKKLQRVVELNLRPVARNYDQQTIEVTLKNIKQAFETADREIKAQLSSDLILTKHELNCDVFIDYWRYVEKLKRMGLTSRQTSNITAMFKDKVYVEEMQKLGNGLITEEEYVYKYNKLTIRHMQANDSFFGQTHCEIPFCENWGYRFYKDEPPTDLQVMVLDNQTYFTVSDIRAYLGLNVFTTKLINRLKGTFNLRGRKFKHLNDNGMEWYYFPTIQQIKNRIDQDSIQHRNHTLIKMPENNWRSERNWCVKCGNSWKTKPRNKCSVNKPFVGSVGGGVLTN
ncbi:MAG: hypothetical protein GY928_33710 [Colwellia sp.]|nr:hypothetical protein [Colwellia sp.]